MRVRLIIVTTLLLLISTSLLAYNNSKDYAKGPFGVIAPVAPLCYNDDVIQLSADPPGGIWSGSAGIVDINLGLFDPSKANIGYNYVFYELVTEEDTIRDTIAIEVGELPDLNIIRVPFAGCAPVSLMFDNHTEQTNNLYSWEFKDSSFNTIGTSNLKQTNFHFEIPAKYHVKLVAVTPQGCIDSVQIPVEIYEGPKADFRPFPRRASLLNATILFNDRSKDAMFWEWDFGDGKFSTEQNPSYTYVKPGKYDVTLVVMSQFLCRDTVTKTVEIIDEHKIYFPNAINIYSAGNNVFYPKGTGIDKNHYELSVFNRAGELIFSTTDFETGWKGTFQNRDGEYVPQGMYRYIANVRDINGRFYVYTGDITVFR